MFDVLLRILGPYLIPVALFTATYIINYFINKNLMNTIEEKEAKVKHIVFSTKKRIDPTRYEGAIVVKGSAVMANCYFMKIIASIISFFGGEIDLYQKILNKGRRLAIARMLEDAQLHGADTVYNVRIATTSINGFELYAYGTAVREKTQ
ncbi:heavy metal-binding domain-containing protein [Lentisphaerota bacterium WC36G]|nr:YbjQ family protein [Lentisphaerae bacterium WC36]